MNAQQTIAAERRARAATLIRGRINELTAVGLRSTFVQWLEYDYALVTTGTTRAANMMANKWLAANPNA